MQTSLNEMAWKLFLIRRRSSTPLKKANEEVSKLHRLSHYQITALADMIATRALESSHAVNVEDIQDMVERGIMEMRGYEVAQIYVR